jgi:DNA end-binding protein Ku
MRSTFTGQLGFGLVQFPVALYKATDDHDVSFKQHHGPSCLGGINYKRVCADCGEAVEYRDIVKGVEVGGSLVTVTEDDLASLDQEAGKFIEITQFVDAAEVDPTLFEATYYVGAGKVGNEKRVRPSKPYALLVAALGDRYAVARYTARNKTHRAVIRVVDGQLVLHNLRWADEIRREEVPGLGAEFSDAELEMAQNLVESMSGEPFDVNAETDTYQERLQALIEAKATGGTFETEFAAVEATTDVSDLLAKLEASVKAKAS